MLARTSGQPARGYYVSSLEIEPATVTVVGPPSVIATMPGLVSIIGEVDVTGATRLIAQRAQLDLPEGASVYTEGDADPSEVLVTVDIDAVMGGTTVEVPLKTRKLREGYSVSLSVPSVDVILTGPSVVLDELALDLVEAYVDLTGLEAGTHQIKVVVELRSSQNPQLADLAVMSVSPAFVEADIDGPAPGAPGTLPPCHRVRLRPAIFHQRVVERGVAADLAGYGAGRGARGATGGVGRRGGHAGALASQHPPESARVAPRGARACVQRAGEHAEKTDRRPGGAAQRGQVHPV